MSFKRYEVKRELNGFKTVEQLVHTTYPGMDSRYMRLVLDGKDVTCRAVLFRFLYLVLFSFCT